jgi:hypothetical protein
MTSIETVRELQAAQSLHAIGKDEKAWAIVKRVMEENAVDARDKGEDFK